MTCFVTHHLWPDGSMGVALTWQRVPFAPGDTAYCLQTDGKNSVYCLLQPEGALGEDAIKGMISWQQEPLAGLGTADGQAELWYLCWYQDQAGELWNLAALEGADGSTAVCIAQWQGAAGDSQWQSYPVSLRSALPEARSAGAVFMEAGAPTLAPGVQPSSTPDVKVGAPTLVPGVQPSPTPDVKAGAPTLAPDVLLSPTPQPLVRINVTPQISPSTQLGKEFLEIVTEAQALPQYLIGDMLLVTQEDSLRNILLYGSKADVPPEGQAYPVTFRQFSALERAAARVYQAAMGFAVPEEGYGCTISFSPSTGGWTASWQMADLALAEASQETPASYMLSMNGQELLYCNMTAVDLPLGDEVKALLIARIPDREEMADDYQVGYIGTTGQGMLECRISSRKEGGKEYQLSGYQYAAFDQEALDTALRRATLTLLALLPDEDAQQTLTILYPASPTPAPVYGQNQMQTILQSILPSRTRLLKDQVVVDGAVVYGGIQKNELTAQEVACIKDTSAALFQAMLGVELDTEEYAANILVEMGEGLVDVLFRAKDALLREDDTSLQLHLEWKGDCVGQCLASVQGLQVSAAQLPTDMLPLQLQQQVEEQSHCRWEEMTLQEISTEGTGMLTLTMAYPMGPDGVWRQQLDNVSLWTEYDDQTFQAALANAADLCARMLEN